MYDTQQITGTGSYGGATSLILVMMQQHARVTNCRGGEKVKEENKGYNNKITRSLRFIMYTSFWYCCSVTVILMDGGAGKGEKLGQKSITGQR